MTQQKPFTSPESLGPAHLLRRLAAAVYDALLVIALLMVITGIYMSISASVLGTEHYRASSETGENIGDPILSCTLFMTLYLFFGYFWTRTGQTLGMQAWHIRIQNNDDTPIRWGQALLRLMGAVISLMAFGIGYVWILVDKKERSWQCILSKTEVVRVAKIKSRK